MIKSSFPYGFTDYRDDRDLLADAEVGRLVLDNSRHSDGTYRRDNKGYFAEIAPMAGTLGRVPGGWFSASPGTSAPSPYERTERYSTPPVVGPEGPIVSVPGDDEGGRTADRPSLVTAIDESIRQVGKKTGMPGWAIALAAGLGLVGVGAAVMGAFGKQRRNRRRQR